MKRCGRMTNNELDKIIRSNDKLILFGWICLIVVCLILTVIFILGELGII